MKPSRRNSKAISGACASTSFDKRSAFAAESRAKAAARRPDRSDGGSSMPRRVRGLKG